MNNVFRKNKRIEIIILALICLWALIGPFFCAHSFDEQLRGYELVKPNGTFILGTDMLGRDIYSRFIKATGVSLICGVLNTLLTVMIGVIIGALAGFSKEKTDLFLGFVIDIFSVFPSILLIVLLRMVLGQTLISFVICYSFTSWMETARVARGLTKRIRNSLYIKSARINHKNTAYIIRKHVVPNIKEPILVLSLEQFAGAILTESFLSFIGIGLPIEIPSLGNMIAESYREILTRPYLVIIPSVLLCTVVICLNISIRRKRVV